MKVYIVKCEIRDCGDTTNRIHGVYYTLEDASKCLNELKNSEMHDFDVLNGGLANVYQHYTSKSFELMDELCGVAYEIEEWTVENYMTYVERYEQKINLITSATEMKQLVREMHQDDTLTDIDFDDLIYDDVIPKLEELGINMEYDEKHKETNYERVLEENYNDN